MKKFVIIYTCVLIIIIGVLSLWLYNIKKNGVNNLGTNQIQLTNYVKKEIPKYINVNLTNFQYLISTNKNNFIDTNLVLVLKISDYSNLIIIVQKYSNYSQSLITAKISNDYLYLAHYDVSNVLKLPNLTKDKKNIVGIGYTLKRDISIEYGYKLFNIQDYDIKVGANLVVPTIFTNIDLGLKLFVEW